jgi:hypothetical protein
MVGRFVEQEQVGVLQSEFGNANRPRSPPESMDTFL